MTPFTYLYLETINNILLLDDLENLIIIQMNVDIIQCIS